MRNRAKCKKCNSVIESFTVTDFVQCECGEIAVDGGEMKFLTYAKNFDNFIRINEKDEEIQVKVVNKDEAERESLHTNETPLDLVKQMIIRYQELPQAAMQAPATNYDILSMLLLIESLLS
jgi:hypothetical protein